eukprot:1136841-Pelagomonas_calceolata.AAC.3
MWTVNVASYIKDKETHWLKEPWVSSTRLKQRNLVRVRRDTGIIGNQVRIKWVAVEVLPTSIKEKKIPRAEAPCKRCQPKHLGTPLRSSWQDTSTKAFCKAIADGLQGSICPLPASSTSQVLGLLSCT